MSPNVKGKTIILANPNTSQQKTIILRSVGPDGNTILQQVPLSSVSGLQNITGNTNNIVLTQGTGSNIIKTSTPNQTQFQQIQTIQTQQQPQQQIVNYQPVNTGLPQTQQGTRLLLTNNSGETSSSALDTLQLFSYVSIESKQSIIYFLRFM